MGSPLGFLVSARIDSNRRSAIIISVKKENLRVSKLQSLDSFLEEDSGAQKGKGRFKLA